MNKNYPKIVALFLAIVLLFGVSAGTLAPRKVEAADWDSPLQLFQQTFTAAKSAASLALTHSLNIKEFALDPLAYAVAKIALQSVTHSVVTWINSGFQGSPAFITDLQANLLRVGDTVANSFFSDLESNLALTSPFQDVLTEAARAQYYISTARNAFSLQHPYTLAQVSPNPTAFYQGHFQEGGGWNSFISSISTMANNPFGARILQQDALTQTLQSAVDTRQHELSFGNGILSYRGPCNNGIQVTSGTTNSDPNVTVSTGQTNSDPNVQVSGGTGATSLDNTDPCLNAPIKTPGTVIHDELSKVLGNGVDQLVSADELDEIVGALMGQLVNNVLGGGGLSGVSQPSSDGTRGSYIDQAANPAQYTKAIGSAIGSGDASQTFVSTVAGQLTELQSYQTNWQKINDSANAAKVALQNSTCTPNKASIIAGQVDPVISQSATALTRANGIITTLTGILTRVTTANASGATDQASAVSSAQAEYTNLLAAIPSANELQYALTQSTDTSALSASEQQQILSQSVGQAASATSLYSQMSTLTAQAQCP